MKATVTVIGAGISGLATAYFLQKRGVPVRILEKQSRVGGLIGTRRTEHGLVETAANGLINSARIEAMCADIGVEMTPLLPQSRSRYFWRNKVRRWPLTVGESLRMGMGLLGHMTRLRPSPGESLSNWGDRIFGPGAVRYAMTPAMGGIYASDAEMLSASLIFNRKGLGLEPERPPIVKPSVRGTVSPKGGMQALIDGMRDYLIHHDVAIELNRAAEILPDSPTVLCTSAPQAAEILALPFPALASHLQKIELLPIVTATCFFQPSDAQPKGFGCLFPRKSAIRALGVLFNECTFPGRSYFRSETWILGGSPDRDALYLSDADLDTILQRNHALLVGREEPMLSRHITRWPHALPHYTLELERLLTTLPSLPPNVFLVGNYLGKIGLAKLIDQAAETAERISSDR